MGFVLSTIRSILLDLPLLLLFSTLLLLLSFRHIHDEYLSHLMRHAFMSEERVMAEYTYYDRDCDIDEISTSKPSDILMTSNSSLYTDKALDTLLTHGAAVFPDLISPSTATKLRDYVLHKNTKLQPTESVFVMEPQNRWSFNPGATDSPHVTQALKEISTNPLLTSTLVKLLGPNPAVVEFNCITAAYGAVTQGWHPDTEATKCHSDHARTYHPQFSLAIPLQDTTPEMGATSICPGTHFCTSMDNSNCDSDGFQVATHVKNRTHTGYSNHRDDYSQLDNNRTHSSHHPNNETDDKQPYWKTGYGLLYNQQTVHKGSAHIDPSAPHRVLFFLTFSSSHQHRKESRVPGFGTTYAMRWDMFGFTLKDLQNAKEAMKQPWAKLRALGLYHPKTYRNGWNWLTMLCIRVINGEVGLEERDLEEFLETGYKLVPIEKIPKVLIGKFVEEEDRELQNSTGWYEFILDTLDKCLYWSGIVYGGFLIFYVVVALMISVYIMWRCSRLDKARKKQNTNGIQNGEKTNGHVQNGFSSKSNATATTTGLPKQRFMHSTVKRLLLSHTILLLIFASIHYQISKTGWAADIKSGQLYTALFPHAGKESVTDGKNYDDDYLDLVASVRKTDVLTGILQFPAVHEIAADKYLDYHVGTVAWRNKMKEYVIDVSTTSSSFSGGKMDDPLIQSYFSWASEQIVRDVLQKDQHRFLIQNVYGNYELMPSGSARELTRRSLMKSSFQLVRSLDEVLSSIMAKSRFSELRGTFMSDVENPLVVMKWRELLFSLGREQGHCNTNQEVPEYLIPISEQPIEFMYTPVVRGRSKIRSEYNVNVKKSLGQPVLFKASRKKCPSSWYMDLPTTTKLGDNSIDVLEAMEYEVEDEVEIFPGGSLNQWFRGTITDKNDDDNGGYLYDVEYDYEDKAGVQSINLRPPDFQMNRMSMKEEEFRKKIEKSQKLLVVPRRLQSNVEHVLVHSPSSSKCALGCDVAGCTPLRSFPMQYRADVRYEEDGILLPHLR